MNIFMAHGVSACLGIGGQGRAGFTWLTCWSHTFCTSLPHSQPYTLLPSPTQSAARDEAAKLVRTSFGEPLLHAVGRVYQMQADIALASFFGSIAAKMKATKAEFKWVGGALMGGVTSALLDQLCGALQPTLWLPRLTLSG